MIAMSEALRIAQIGCGEIAAAHLQAYEETPAVCLAMTMDVVEEAARELGERAGVPWTTELGEVLDSDEVDAVSIATPHNTHSPIAVAALEAGKHALCEKPLAESMEAGRRMVAAAGASDRLLSMWMVMRYGPHVQEARRLVAAGALGEIEGLLINTLGHKGPQYWHHGVSGRSRYTDWRGHREQAGGGILIMNSVHQIDLWRYVTGLNFAQVAAHWVDDVTDNDVEDFISVSFQLENGAAGSIIASSCVPGGSNAADRLVATRAQLHFGAEGHRVFLVQDFEEYKGGQWETLKGGPGRDRRAWLAEEFAAAVSGGGPAPIPGEEGLLTLAPICAAYEAAASGRTVRVEGEGA
jgi:UDP-N-acetylglucosamine 3-dehydrogenase